MALGFEHGGFDPVALVEIDPDTCSTLMLNRPHWNVLRANLPEFDPAEHPVLSDTRVDLVACGLPRSPYTVAGRQLATGDRRDMLQAAVEMVVYMQPRAVVLENIPGFATSGKFGEQRSYVQQELADLGYDCVWQVLAAEDFGVPQRRSHGVVVAMRPDDLTRFSWPVPVAAAVPGVGGTLYESMAANGWPDAARWASEARGPAPAVVGGATGRGAADLGPTRSKEQWRRLGVYGGSIGDTPPGPDFVLDHEVAAKDGLPRLTVEQVALLQGFPAEWKIVGRKTSAYRQISQATPPPLAAALGRSVAAALTEDRATDRLF